MNYEEFKQKFIEELGDIFESEGRQIHISEALKNNGRKLDGITLQPPTGQNVGCTIYVQYMYEAFLRGDSLDEVIFKARASLLNGEQEHQIDVRKISRENADNCLYAVVINAPANQELLQDTPHRIIEDLAVVARYRMQVPGGEGSFIVRNNHLSLLQLTKDEVIAKAMANVEKEAMVCESMSQVISGMLENGDGELLMDELIPSDEDVMYVLSNPQKVYGANVLASKDKIVAAMEQIGEDCYILSSSLHEVILVPKSKADSLEALQEMVKSVNDTEVAPEEVLSDNVYELNPRTKRLQIAGTQPVMSEEVGERKKACLKV